MGGYILSIDCGTQSIRAIVFDEKGEMLAKQKQTFQPYYSVRLGYAEQDAELFWNMVCQACLGLKESNKEVFDQIKGVVLTAQRNTCVLVDKEGNVLRPVISWADQRLIPRHKKVGLFHQLTTQLVGMWSAVKLLNRQCKAHWIQENEPEIWEKTYKYLMLPSYLNYCLTGEFKDSSANQIGHIPFEYKDFEWARKGSLKTHMAQIERNKLCELVEPTDVLGEITEEAAKQTGLSKGTIVYGGGSDKGCETIGVGCVNNKTISISLGSQATIQTTTPKYYEIQSFIPPFPAVIPKHYNPDLQIYRGYWMISWFKEQFAEKELVEAEKLGIPAEELLSQKIKEINPGCDGLMLQPYWGAGLKNPEARGAIFGFSDTHTRIHVYRAIIEGIGFALYNGLQKIEKKSGVKIERVMISGGGSQSDEICQITADIFNLPVSRVQTFETSSLGAAILGYVANGTYQSFDEAIDNMTRISCTFEPNKENHQLYKALYNKVYKKTYGRLKPLYTSIASVFENTNG